MVHGNHRQVRVAGGEIVKQEVVKGKARGVVGNRIPQ